ncbi:Uncharacterised protein [Salmonella enterica]|nr:Uncharacterised protein [Salmonella enterica]
MSAIMFNYLIGYFFVQKIYENNDVELNQIYKNIMKIIAEEYKSQPELKAECIEKYKHRKDHLL